jgi:hypothetical protein
LLSFDYAVLRVVPRVELEEFVNAGVIVFCLERDFLDARVELDHARVLALCPDCDLPLIERHLQAVPRICAGGEGSGPIGRLSQRERFHWLVAPRSTVLQVSPVHSGLCEDPNRELEHLVAELVRAKALRAPGSPSGRNVEGLT